MQVGKTIVLINPNRLKPPISPVGLEYIAEVLRHAGHHIVWVDLCFAEDWGGLLRAVLDSCRPDYIGITLRNIDEAMMASQVFYVDFVKAVIQVCKDIVPAPVILGGAGFSIAPKEILGYTGADFGLVGNGVEQIDNFILSLETQTYSRFPGCLYWEDGNCISNIGGSIQDLGRYASISFSRDLADLERYYTEGGQIGIETKRGCTQECVYCVESHSARLSPMSLRDPVCVCDEVSRLVDRGITVFHWCDSEFNIPMSHALRVCEELIRRGIHHHIRWYTYCAPVPFSEELAVLMDEAGCAGINFAVDSLHDGMLQILRKSHRLEDVQQLMGILRKTDIAVMFDLLLGAPGETKETALHTIDQALRCKPDALGISFGVRLYPYTHLGKKILALSQEDNDLHQSIHGIPLTENPNLLFPTYYLSNQLDRDFFSYLTQLAQGDPTIFLSLPATEEGSYSYCNHEYLVEAIRKGARGAYWDILRRRRWEGSDESDRSDGAGGG